MVASIFPATHSTVTPTALLTGVLSAYAVGQPSEWHLMILGLNDTYLVRTTNGLYVLRVYRAHWRSLPEIRYELDVLTHLGRKGLSASTPVARRDGKLTTAMETVEGTRHAVLFTFAPGNRPLLNEEHSRLYGNALAEIHNALDDFCSPHPRSPLDLEYLLERPLSTILPFLNHRPDDVAHLVRFADVLRARMACLPAELLTTGVCHGDVHDENAHLDRRGTVTPFDFDCCGPGWTAYDVATFRWRLGRLGLDNGAWTTFLDGYAAKRLVTDVDLRAIPVLVGLRETWQMSLHFINGNVRGFGTLDERFFDAKLRFSREWAFKLAAEA